MVVFAVMTCLNRYVPKGNTDQDLPEIVEIRKQKKLKLKERQLQQAKSLDKLSVAIYSKLIEVCSDILYNRKETRNAFEKWLTAVNLKSKKKFSTSGSRKTDSILEGNGSE
jgi:hypothetical protein